MPRPRPTKPTTLHAPTRGMFHRPGRTPSPPDPYPNVIRPATREETAPAALAATVLTFLALIVGFQRNYLLLYGDAVAHLGIARRILDTRNPGLQQFGGVWLPLPHILLLPFVANIAWWQNGIAGAWPSMFCYILAVAGFYRLGRRLLVRRWAFAATAFFALNPNLLYLSTTAMTEPLFLALLIWLTLLTLEAVAAIRAQAVPEIPRKLIQIGLLILAAVYTRYDGWILGAAIWIILAWQIASTGLLRRLLPSFTLFTLITIAGPTGWFVFNHHYFHDWLDFMRGPYSAYAIDLRTKPPGAQHHRGWHNPAWALLFYTRTAQVDSTAWELGFLTMAAAITGLVFLCRRVAAFAKDAAMVTRDNAVDPAAHPYGREALVTLLLWLPVPFYVYSIAWGSVPIFIPNLWPHAFYNSRYGMELLPALALFTMYALAALEGRLTRPLHTRLLQPITLALIAFNSIAMMYWVPLVLKEAQHNSTSRIALESALAGQLETFPPGVPILMYNSDYVGALEKAGIPLKQTINEGDYDSFHAALQAPAQHANFVVAVAGDPVAEAVAKHPENLMELVVLCTTGQPCARIYQSTAYKP